MLPMRVFIVRHGTVVDVIGDFEDPRLTFIRDFNRLNRDTEYRAVLAEMVTSQRRAHLGACRRPPRCRPSDDNNH